MRRPWWRRWAVTALLTIGAPWASLAASGESPPSLPLTRDLEFVEQGFALQVPLELSEQEVRFKQEPDFSGNTTRAAIPLNKTRSEFVGFAWDQDSGKLYVDMDRDLDLTDEKALTPSFDPIGIGSTYDVVLPVEHGELTVPYHLSISLWNEWYAYVQVKSGWVGTIDLGGHTYRVSVADNLDSQFGEGDAFALTPSAAGPAAPTDNLEFFGAEGDGSPKYLSVHGFAFEVTTELIPSPEGAVVRLTLIQPSTPTGTLALEGGHIEKLVFAFGNDLFFAYPDGASVPAPQGRLKLERLVLEGGWQLATPNGPTVMVSAGDPNPLRLGGPLRETIAVSRTGNALLLEYSVKGIGGEDYTGGQDYSNPPRFAVYQGDRKVGGGAFDYG